MANGAGFSGKSAPWMLGALAAAVIGGGIWYTGRTPEPGAVIVPGAEENQPAENQAQDNQAQTNGTAAVPAEGEAVAQATTQSSEPAPSAVPQTPETEAPGTEAPENAPAAQADAAQSETGAPETTQAETAVAETAVAETATPETGEPQATTTEPEPEPAPEPAPTFRAPDFDVVRVETDGSALIAGSAEPGAQVRFLLDSKEIGVTRADTGGKFAAFLTLEPSQTPRVLTLLATANGQQSESEDQIILAPVAPVEVAAAEPAPESEPEPAPEIAAVTDEPAVSPQTSGDDSAPATPSQVAKTDPEPAPEADPEPALPAAVAQAEPEAEAETTALAQTSEPAQGTEPSQQLAQITPETDPPAKAAAPDAERAEPQPEEQQSSEPAPPQEPQPQTAEGEAAPEPEPATTQIAEQSVAPETPIDTAPATRAPGEAQEPTAQAAEIATLAEENLTGEQAVSETQSEAETVIADVASVPEPSVEPAPATAPEPAPQVAQEAPAAEPVETTRRDAAPLEATPAEGAGTEVARAEQEGEQIALAQTAPPQAPKAPEVTVPEAKTSDPALAPAPTQDTQAPPVPTGAQAEPPAAPGAVAVLRATRDGIELLQPATPRRPEAMAQIALDTIGYSETGDVQLAGRAQGKSVVRIYLDNKPVADLNAAEDGQWKGQLSGITPGIYTLRLDELGQTGQVLSRIETPFKRESPDVLNPPAPEDAPEHQPLIRAVTVQKGDTLWAISRSRYGDGLLYVRVFQANRTSIRDPDLIYPGQVFALPD